MADPLTHAKLGTCLELKAADELRQRDLNKYMAAQREPKLGDSLPEFHHRILFAALKAGWVKDARITVRTEPLTAADVADLSPVHVRWFAEQVNDLYLQLVTIPPE